MRYGLLVANVGTYSDPRNVVRLAAVAEESGWEALLVWDHLAFVWGPLPPTPGRPSARVRRRRHGSWSAPASPPVPRRRPQVLAQAATIDVLSGGRFVFGAGLGGIPSEFTAFGEEDAPRTRAEQLDEGLDLLRRLWAGERVEHDGRHYRIDGVTLAPLPVQQPVPIWIGGNSPRALARAARFDGWFADSSDPHRMTIAPEELTRRVETIGRGDGFDVVVHGYSDQAEPSAYADAGATWWLEDVHDTRGAFDDLLTRIAAGPPA